MRHVTSETWTWPSEAIWILCSHFVHRRVDCYSVHRVLWQVTSSFGLFLLSLRMNRILARAGTYTHTLMLFERQTDEQWKISAISAFDTFESSTTVNRSSEKNRVILCLNICNQFGCLKRRKKNRIKKIQWSRLQIDERRIRKFSFENFWIKLKKKRK